MAWTAREAFRDSFDEGKFSACGIDFVERERSD